MHVMRCEARCALGVPVVLLLAILTSFLQSAWCSPSVTGSFNEGRGGEDMGLRREMANKGGDERPAHPEIKPGKSEQELIQPIRIPFKQQADEWEVKGISLTALGEPKSGTTWFARVIAELCLQLCGNPENTWCEMGGLTVSRSFPAPRYEFEMLHAESGEVFLHFEGKVKHEIPGIGIKGGCSRGGVPHVNSWGLRYPCGEQPRDITRGSLTACLPDTSPACLRYLPPLDPTVKRMAVVFRDPRNVIISEHKMRMHVYHHDVGELEPFVHRRFETVLAWIHQRWVWHTTAVQDISYVVFYEDLKAHPHNLVKLAAFLGLDCTAEEAEDVWLRHTHANPPGDYTTYGLSDGTLEWMNVTMATILPEVMLARYGLTPIFT